VPAAFQQQLELQVREAGSGVLLTWSTPWPAVYGERLELTWPGATSADQAALDLGGGVFATPPYEVDLRPVLRVDGAEVASGEAIGSAEDVELLATLAPPQGSPTVARFEMFAGEHAVLTADFGQIPQETVDRYTAGRDAAADPDEKETWAQALAGAAYLRSLSRDLEHLAALRYRRVVQVGNVVLAVQRGAVSRSADGTPLTFGAAPPSLELGAMVVGLFPADGVAGPDSTSVSTLELLGAQGSAREGEALAQALGGDHLTAVGFLTRAAREGQTLTRVDATNVEPVLAAAELSADAEASVRAGAGHGLIAWISEAQLPFETWDSTGYVLQDPSTGAGGYFVTFERLVQGLEANLVFHSPQDLDVVTAPIDVVATLEGEEIESWTLAYRAADGGPTVELARGTGSFSNATLGQFDPTLLLNGLYDIVLTARDAAGQMASQKISISVEGQQKIGQFALSFVDVAVPVSGLDLEVVRTYDSRQAAVQGDFGQGWSLDLRQGSYRNNRPPGDGWQLAGGFLPCDSTLESKSHLTVIRLSEREIYRFAMKIVDGVPSTGGGCFGRAEFQYVDGPIPGATLAIRGNDQVYQETQSADRVLSLDTLDTYVPEDVRLTTRDGRVFDLNLDIGVTRVEDPNGNQLEIRAEGIFHSAGKAVDFERDAEGRITRITDPAGNERIYTYDASGDLVVTADPLGHETRFTYDDDHRIVDIVDPRGVQAVRSEYDADGRLVKVTDARGNDIRLNHELAARREIITNRLGVAQVFEYDARGNVITETDELGHVTTRTFDGKDRLLTETDPLGNTTANTYDGSGDLVSVRDPLGNTTRFTYAANGNLLTITDPRGKITTNTYDARGNLTSTMDPLGHVTELAYDARGNLVQETDALGKATTFAFDGSGNQTRIVDVLGTETTWTYDLNGNVTSQNVIRMLPDGSTETLTTTFTVDAVGRTTATTLPDGSTTSTVYDSLGAVLSATDALGRVTTYAYDAAGDQTGTTYPDGTSDTSTYDAEGRLVAYTDRAGRTTSFDYDEAGRSVSTIFPDGSTTASAFDAVGRVVTSTDARGSTTTYGYDVAGRRIRVTNAHGAVTSFDYDAAGNQQAVTDPLGRTTTFTYDDAGQLISTTLPDGESLTMEYDELGRRIAALDQVGVRTEYAHDVLGRLVQVTDSLGGVTGYTYDQVGNLLTQTDANGHTTTFEYDQLGRQRARILPDGARESFTYDANGSRTSRTDFNGTTTTFAYDVNGRLTSRTYPDGTFVSFSYTPMGRRASVTDSRGVTTYAYDARDRLVRQVVPEGYELRYTWDAAGNRTSVEAELQDRTTLGASYTYDAASQLATVTDSRGGIYAYTWDAAGQRETVTYPNGVVTTYAHDSAGRLLELRTESAIGDVLQSYAYQLGSAGYREAVTDWDGTVRSYEYDALYRLVEDWVETGAGELVYQNSFTYDSVGNRLRQVRTTGPLVDGSPAAVETIDYGYDVRGRLLTESSVASGGVRDLTYVWDANGNQLGKSGTEQNGASVASTFVWDHEDRLSGVERIDGASVVHRYDADGVWMGQSVAGGSEPGEKGWVVDLSRPLSQVIGELDAAGALVAEFARGGPTLGADDLLGLLPVGGNELFYHLDALGSVRGLTDSQSAVTQRFAYEAFGEALEVSAVSGNPFRFAGEPYSQASSAYHLRARWLDSGSGRFNSQDPVPSFIGVPQSHHLFTYAAGDPVNKVDPTGESFLSLSLGALAIMTVVAVIAIHQLQRPLGGGRRSIVKNIRPVVLEDLKQPWSDAEVNQLLSHGRSLLSREAGVSYNWSRTIERRSNFDSYIDPGIDTEAHADHLIWSLWTEAPQFYPVVFATLLDYKPGASGVTQAIGDWSTLGWRGSIITRYGWQNNERTVVAHELSHGFGFNGHVRIPGRLMTTLGSGERLSANEIMRIRLYSQPLR
jgi:RHS repeat-associated protein